MDDKHQQDIAEVLSRLEAQKKSDAPILKKIESHTSILPRLFGSLSVDLKKTAEAMKTVAATAPSIKHRVFTERARDEKGRFASSQAQPEVATSKAVTIKKKTPAMPSLEAKETTAPAVRAPRPPLNPAVPQQQVTAPAPVPPLPKIVSIKERTPEAARRDRAPLVRQTQPAKERKPAQAPATPTTEGKVRDEKGRFYKSQEALDEAKRKQDEAQKSKGIIGALKTGLKSLLAADKSGSAEEAAGKAVGGPIYESAKELREMAGELGEKIRDEKSIAGKVFRAIGARFGRKKDPTTTAVERTEKAEQRRHRELVQAIKEQPTGGGDGGNGIVDGITGGLLSRFVGPLMGALSSMVIPAIVGAVGAALGAVIGTALNKAINAVVERVTGKKTAGEAIYDTLHPDTGAKDAKAFNQRYSQYGETVKQAAAKNGISEDFLKTSMALESGGKADATNNKSSAKGLFQFTNGTAKAYGIEGREFDPTANIQAAARLARDNAASLQRQGVPVSDSTLYLNHQLGTGAVGKGGVVDLLSAAKTGTASQALRKQMDLNGGEGMAPADFLSMWRKRYIAKAIDLGADPNSMTRVKPSRPSPLQRRSPRQDQPER